MHNDSIVIFGAGGHAKVVVDVIECQAKYKISAVYDSDINKTILLDYPIYHEISRIKDLRVNKGIVAIGNNHIRKLLVKEIVDCIPDFQFITAIHPSVTLARGVHIDAGTVVMPGVCINTDTIIGKHCIINTGVYLDHENILSDYVNISPGSVTGGNVVVRDLAFVGLGSKIIQKVFIGSNSFIGAGSLVIRDIPTDVLAFGSPAKIIRFITDKEKFI